MKYLVLVLLCLFLQGCFYQSVNENDIRLGTEWCKIKGSELLYIKAWWTGSETVVCKDNQTKDTNKLKPEDLIRN